MDAIYLMTVAGFMMIVLGFLIPRIATRSEEIRILAQIILFPLGGVTFVTGFMLVLMNLVVRK